MNALPEFALRGPRRCAEAAALLAGDPARGCLAGGTDLLPNLRRGLEQPAAAGGPVGAARLRDVLELRDGALTLGAGVTLAQLADDARIAQRLPALAEAARAVAGPGHRSVATLGGNLCQDTRCVYYNQSEWWRASQRLVLEARRQHLPRRAARPTLPCRVQRRPRAGAAGCGAEVELAIVPRRAPHAAGRAVPRRRRGAPHAGRRRAAPRCASPHGRTARRSGYRKARVRGAMDFPLAGVAVVLSLHDGALADARRRPERHQFAADRCCKAPMH